MADAAKCPTCAGTVSTEAVSCPHCGQPRPPHGWSPRLSKPHATKYGVVLAVTVASLALVIGRFWYERQTRSTVAALPAVSQEAVRRPIRVKPPSNWLPHVGAMVIIRKNALACPSERVLSAADSEVEKASAVDDPKKIRRAIRTSIRKGCRQRTYAMQGQVTGSSNVPEPMFRVRLSSGKTYWLDRAYLTQLGGTSPGGAS